MTDYQLTSLLYQIQRHPHKKLLELVRIAFTERLGIPCEFGLDDVMPSPTLRLLVFKPVTRLRELQLSGTITFPVDTILAVDADTRQVLSILKDRTMTYLDRDEATV